MVCVAAGEKLAGAAAQEAALQEGAHPIRSPQFPRAPSPTPARKQGALFLEVPGVRWCGLSTTLYTTPFFVLHQVFWLSSHPSPHHFSSGPSLILIALCSLKHLSGDTEEDNSPRSLIRSAQGRHGQTAPPPKKRAKNNTTTQQSMMTLS